MMSWSVSLVVILVVGLAFGALVRMPVLLILAAIRTPSLVILVVGYMITAAALVAAFWYWRTLRKAVRDEELHSR